MDKLDKEQIRFANHYGSKVGQFWVQATRKADKMFGQHPDFFDKTLPAKTTAAKIIRGPKNPDTTLGPPKKSLYGPEGVKRTQLLGRLRPIKKDFLDVCEEEKVDDPMALLALLGKSLFLDTNGKYFDPVKGKFFQSYLKGNYTVNDIEKHGIRANRWHRKTPFK